MGKQKFKINKLFGKCKCGANVKSFDGVITNENGKQVLYCKKCLAKLFENK